MINQKRKIHSYNNLYKYWDETRILSTTPRLRGGNTPSLIQYCEMRMVDLNLKKDP